MSEKESRNKIVEANEKELGSKKEEKNPGKSSVKKINIAELEAQEKEKKENFSKNVLNWESLDNEKEYERSEMEKFRKEYEKTLVTINEKEIVEGTIVAKTAKEVVVNIGYKSDGVVSLNELRYRKEINIGDKIEVYIESLEDHNGQIILSHKRARTLNAWKRINEALQSEKIVKGFIKCRTKGGLIVDLWGIECFLPGSQIDINPVTDYDQFVGKTMEFKVVKINTEIKNVVVSHKAIIEEEIEQQKREIISKLEKGQVLEGKVKNVTSYGVFVDLGGIDGLIHITDLTWARISHPEEIVKVGDKVKVVILDFDENKTRIALGMKQLTKHPWESLDDKKLKVGDKIKGKVVVVTDYGAFVEIQPGIEGLVHVSEISWATNLKRAQDFLKVGDIVEAKILSIEKEERRIALSIKQLSPDPWANIKEKFDIGSKHKGRVENLTKYGMFVYLDEGVEGFLHINDLSWTKKYNHPSEFAKKGDEVEVVVLDIDFENRKLTLGHKQLTEDPWETYASIYKKGTIHKGTIYKFKDKEAIINLAEGGIGYAKKKTLLKKDGSMPEIGETLDFYVLNFSKENKKITLSHISTYKQSKKEKHKKKGKKIHKKVKMEKTTLGDLEVLAEIKSGLEKEEKEENKKEKKQF